jgi:hypothetical protein
VQDNEMKAGIFPGEVIIVAGGKLLRFHFSFNPFFISWPISPIGGGISTGPQPTNWLTTTGQCLPGVLKFHHSEAYRF